MNSAVPTIIRSSPPYSIVVYEGLLLPSQRPHGSGPALVDATMADVYVQDPEDETRVYRVGRGITYRNPTDEHNRRVGVLRACRRAIQDASETKAERSYLSRMLLHDVAAQVDSEAVQTLVAGRNRVAELFAKLFVM